MKRYKRTTKNHWFSDSYIIFPFIAFISAFINCVPIRRTEENPNCLIISS